MIPSLHYRPDSSIPRFLRSVQLVLLVTFIVSVAACRNTARVGFGQGVTDSGLMDSPATDDARDASSQDSGAPPDSSKDAGPDTEPDATMVDAGPNTAVDASVGSCVPPWLLVVARETDGSKVIRFSLDADRPIRCEDLEAGGVLPRSTVDAVALDMNTVVVAGPDGVFAIDVVTDTVRWMNPGVAAAVDVQAVTLRSDPPWVGVAWWTEPSRIARLQGFSADGTNQQEWNTPAQLVSVSAHPADDMLYGSGWDSGLHVFVPFTGASVEELPLLSLRKMHVVPGDPPRISGHLSGSFRLGTLEPSPSVFTHFIDGCDATESAPRPQNDDEAFVRCGSGSTSVIRRYRVMSDESEVILSASTAEPDLEFAGLGVFE